MIGYSLSWSLFLALRAILVIIFFSMISLTALVVVVIVVVVVVVVVARSRPGSFFTLCLSASSTACWAMQAQAVEVI